MLEVKNKKTYEYLFDNYGYAIPLIEASINDDYESHLYLDKEKEPKLAVLTTPFYSMYFSGDITYKNLSKTLDNLIFKNHIPTYHQKKLYAYAPSDIWNDTLESIFLSHDGYKEERYFFSLDKEKFEKAYSELKKDDNVFEYKLEYRNDRHAKINYPSISCYIGDEKVGFSTGYTLAKGIAQIDTHTFKEYRGKGIAKQTSLRIIKELLDRGLTVTFISNPKKEETVKLAESLGFIHTKTIPVYVWKLIKK